MEYALLIYTDESQMPAEPTPADMEAHARAFAGIIKEMTDRGLLRNGSPLRPTPTATTVRVRDGKTLTVDGPFAETKEQLAGFFIVDCEDLDQAIDIAGRIPAAAQGAIEIRPVSGDMEKLIAKVND